MDKIEIIWNVFFIIALLSLGWIGNIIYTDWNNEKQINGLWMRNYNYTQAKDKAYQMDNSGQWVMVNIDSSMSYEQIINTCTHEASHELFARKCTEKPEVCFKLMENLNETK